MKFMELIAKYFWNFKNPLLASLLLACSACWFVCKSTDSSVPPASTRTLPQLRSQSSHFWFSFKAMNNKWRSLQLPQRKIGRVETACAREAAVASGSSGPWPGLYSSGVGKAGEERWGRKKTVRKIQTCTDTDITISTTGKMQHKTRVSNYIWAHLKCLLFFFFFFLINSCCRLSSFLNSHV